MTLTEFLLARIAADEESAKDAEEDGVHAFPHSPRRLLAECEAKRSIVATLRACHSTRFPRDTATDVNHFTPLAWGIFCDLAAPYTDHPDYRQEWRL